MAHLVNLPSYGSRQTAPAGLKARVAGLPAFNWRANARRTVMMATDALVLAAALFLTDAIAVALQSRPADYGLILAETTFSALWLGRAAFYVAFGVVVLAGFSVYSPVRSTTRLRKLALIAAAVVSAHVVLALLSTAWPTTLVPSSQGLLVSAFIALPGMLAARGWSHLWRRASTIDARAGSTHGPSPQRRRKVLVIGGGGYIGSALVPRLLDEGCEVRVLDLMMYGLEPLGDTAHHQRCEIVEADFRRVDVLVQAMAGIDEVVHLGGLVGDPACAFDEELTVDINVAATRAVAEVAKGAGVQSFVFASSCSVYGASDQVLDERSPLSPVSLYARTKIASERILFELADDRFQPIVVRFATIYGISGRTRFDLVVNLLSAKACFDGEITVFGGASWRPFLHVADAARAVALLLGREPARQDQPLIFNVGSNAENYTIGQVGRLVQAQVPGSTLSETPDDDADRRNYRVDFSKIERAVGFHTSWTVAKGISQVIEQIRSGAVRDYRDPLHSNLLFLRQKGSKMLAPPRPVWPSDVPWEQGVQFDKVA